VPTSFLDLSWERRFSRLGHLEAKLGVVESEERRAPYAGPNVPAIATFQVATTRQYTNAVFDERMRPSNRTGSIAWRGYGTFGPLQSSLTVGAEASLGTWTHTRHRTGGMTWRPRYYPGPAERFDPANPLTWDPQIPSGWGGEVNVDAQVRNDAAFVQSAFTWGRVTVNPGLRVGAWKGDLRGTDGNRFTAVKTSGIEPRVGAVFDLSGLHLGFHEPGETGCRCPAPESSTTSTPTTRQSDFVLRVHWGRFHQGLFAEMFDRAAGSASYTDAEVWEYLGPLFQDPRRTFSVAERDALARAGTFRLIERVELSQTGRVDGFRQPYVDQSVIGLEKSFRGRLKLGALWLRRDNYDIAALVDRNAATNWTEFENVHVLFRGEQLYDHRGEPFILPKFYVRNDAMLWVLREHARLFRIDPDLARGMVIPGYRDADTARLRFDPDYVLTSAPGARRRFEQLQLTASATFPRWSVSSSLARSNLRGNMFAVSGYDPSSLSGRDRLEGRGPGMYIRPNEQLNSWGKLDNYSTLELKLLASVELPSRFRAGAFFHHASGDRLTPSFTVARNGMGYYLNGSNAAEIISPLLMSAEGNRIFSAPRGSFKYASRHTLDLRVSRSFPVYGREWELSADAFNVLGHRGITLVNTALEAQVDPNFDTNFFDPLRRVDPRRLRAGATVRF
jgi:hypothetical protein